MNPNNKLIIPVPNKASKKDPYERVQSAPPDGKEDDKIRDMNIKQAFKNWQVNPGQKVRKIHIKKQKKMILLADEYKLKRVLAKDLSFAFARIS